MVLRFVNIKIFSRFAFLFILIALIECQPEIPYVPNDSYKDTLTGTVVFDFPIPVRNVPIEAIHRIDLSIAKTAYDIYRGHFLINANTYDSKQSYTFTLLPGDYYYQAGIICTCLGDTCNWDGFPGGSMGAKWTMGLITIVKGEKLQKVISFLN